MASNTSTFEQQVIELTNAERAKNGLSPLQPNAELNYAADKYAGEMAARGVMSHTGADGSKPWDRARAVGFDAQIMGENIAARQKTPQQVVQAWMNSPGHRANILRPQFTQIGTGFEQNYWVQKFGSNDRNPISKIPNAPSDSVATQPEPQPKPVSTPPANTGSNQGDNTSGGSTQGSPTPTPVSTSDFERRVIELTNQERAKNGLAPLKANPELNYTADKYAEEMAARRVLSHTGADGSKPWDRAKAIGYEAQVMGENIAAGQKTPEQVVQAWMNSSGHRANILRPQFTEIGTGYHQNYWVQNFGSGDRNPISKIPGSSVASQPTSESTPQSAPTVLGIASDSASEAKPLNTDNDWLLSGGRSNDNSSRMMGIPNKNALLARLGLNADGMNCQGIDKNQLLVGASPSVPESLEPLSAHNTSTGNGMGPLSSKLEGILPRQQNNPIIT